MAQTQDVFAHNLEVLGERWPSLAVTVPHASLQHYSFCETLQGEINLQRSAEEDVDDIDYFHSQQSAAAEANQWFANLQLENVQVLYVFGLGLGHYYEAAVNWLRQNPQHYLVFLENDLSVIHHFLYTPHAEMMIKDPQMHIIFVPLDPVQGVEAGGFLSGIVDYFSLSPMKVSALSFYAHTQPELFSLLNQKLITLHAVYSQLVSQQLNINQSFYKQYYANLKHLIGSINGNHLFGKFCRVPVIICGAGPSLDKAVPLLRQLNSHALIMAGGSALTALTHQEVVPHLAAGLSPHPAESQRFYQQTGFEVPLFYRPRIDPTALNYMHGPRVYTNGTTRNDTARWIEEQLGIYGTPLDEGSSIIYFCTELAIHLGCDPIIYVGMDLAHTDKKVYAEGVVDQNEPPSQSQDLFFQTVNAKDIYGEVVETVWKWVAEAEALGKYAVTRSGHRTFLNATEGGIGIPGVPNVTLTEAISHMQHGHDLRARLHGELVQAQASHVTQERLHEVVNTLQASLETCEELIEQIVDELKQIEAQIIPQILEPIHRRAGMIKEGMEQENGGSFFLPDTEAVFSGRLALLEVELTEEIAHQVLLRQIDEQRTYHLRRLHDEFRREGSSSKFYRRQRKVAIMQERYRYLQQCARENREMLLLVT
jgi:hypothetical protein